MDSENDNVFMVVKLNGIISFLSGGMRRNGMRERRLIQPIKQGNISRHKITRISAPVEVM